MSIEIVTGRRKRLYNRNNCEKADCRKDIYIQKWSRENRVQNKRR